jgi:Fanconi anemia group M protein
VSKKPEDLMSHPLIREGSIKRREYQVKIATKAIQKPTLVVLPTGLGKTVVALIVLAERFNQGKGPAIMLAPTKPLVEQHVDFMGSFLKGTEIVMLTGEIPPAKRKEYYGKGNLIISTPQVIKNDIITGILDIGIFSTMIVDEAHRAVGDYPYVFISELFYERSPEGIILGLTASPGHDVSRIYDVCRNLGMEQIEVRIDSDPDVQPYIRDMEVTRIKVDLSDGMRSVIQILQRMFMDRVGKLQRMGVIRRGPNTSVKELIGAAGRIQEMIRKAGREGGAYYQAMSIQAQAMKISHAVELAETQGAESLYQYLDRLIKETGKNDCSKATRKVVSDPLFKLVINKTEALRKEIPPKIVALERTVIQKLREDPSSRIIAFTHFRDTASLVHQRMMDLEQKGIKPVRFVGQASRSGDTGLSQKEQKQVLEGFRNGEHNLLIATSVAEEGLDIPGADLVIFYEPIPSEIRTIQRRGRTGRHSSGKVVVLMSRETRDVAYSFSARDKELKMERQLLSLRRMLSKMPLPSKRSTKKVEELLEKPEETTLESFDANTEEGKPEIIADMRELTSSVAEELIRKGFRVIPAQLGEGDYVIAEGVIIERKTSHDLSDSLIDGRLFDQASRLASSCENPMIVIEGDDLFNQRKINRNALMGAMASLAMDFRIPLIKTMDPVETAEFIISAYKRQKGKNGPKKTERRKGQAKMDEIALSVLSGLPGISNKLAGRLLKRFTSLKGIFNAEASELEKVEGIGKMRAREIHNVMNQEL